MELIVKYDGDLKNALKTIPQVQCAVLYGNFAVLSFPDELLPKVQNISQISYIQYPVRVFFEESSYLYSSCAILPKNEYGLYGKGVLIAVIDSGIDLRHRCFLTDQNKTRFKYYWDQAGSGPAPDGYFSGTEYSEDEINELLAYAPELLPGDSSGHGSAVAGIAAGYDKAAGYEGMAPCAMLLGVSIMPSGDYPKTSGMMQAVNYCIEKSLLIGAPLVINLSFGNNYGSHSGRSLLEDYLNLAAITGKTCIVAGTGNEGAAATHASGIPDADTSVAFNAGAYQSAFSIQLWKDFTQEWNIKVTSPGGFSTPYLSTLGDTGSYVLENTTVNILIGKPAPILPEQGIYFEFENKEGGYVTSGIWRIDLKPLFPGTVKYNLWMPSSQTLSADTRFLMPDPDITLTIPSTAAELISVGAYNSNTNSYSSFSGRGYTAAGQIKPDITAGGEKIPAPAVSSSNNAYALFTGTSFSAPIVSGACALLMEWGIVRGNDPEMYGQKVKAYLRMGARPLSLTVPNTREGYGRLCLSDSLNAVIS